MKRLFISLLLSITFLPCYAPPIKMDNSLVGDSFMKDYLYSKRIKDLFHKICTVESSNNPKAFNKKENAAGIIQIRPIMLKEINSLFGYEKYSLEDRWDVDKSFEMFKLFQMTFNPSLSFEIGSRIWNGGRQGHTKESTLIYWHKIKSLS